MRLRDLTGVGRDTALVGSIVVGTALFWGLPAAAQSPQEGDQPGPAVAPRWQFTPSIQVGQSYTSNVRAVSKNPESDFYTTISPGFTVTGNGGRVQGSARYQLNYDRYFSATDLNGLRHDLLGTGRAELIDESLFVDVSASVSQQPISREDAISATDRALSTNRTDVVAFQISPFYRNRFGGWAESELRYTLGQVYFLDPSNAASNDPQRQNANISSDSTSHRITGSLSSGTYFSRLLWSFRADLSTVERDSGTFEQRSFEAETDYVVDRTVKLILQTGYDDYSDPTLTTDLSGPYVMGGFELTPGPRSKLRFTAGERRNGFLMNGNLSYRLTDRLAFNASYTDTIETQQSSILNNLGFLVQDPFGNFVDSRTGQVFTDRDLAQFRLTDSAFRNQQLLASLSGQYGLNSGAVTVFHTTREPQGDTSAGASTLGTETVTGVNVTYSRSFSPYLNGTLGASASTSDTEGGDGRSDVTVRGTASLQYLFSSTLRGALSLSYLNRDRKTNTTAPQTGQSQGDLQETVVSATLIKTF